MADGASSTVVVRYFAAARAAAATPEEKLTVQGTATLADVLAAAVQLHGAALERVLARCSYLRNEVAVHGGGSAVADGDVIDVLPPFAGG